MQLSPSDIQRLYGKKLFILEEKEQATSPNEQEVKKPEIATTESAKEVDAVQTPSPFSSGAPVIWKMKPEAKLALILHKSEFTNRELTGLLKASLVKAGINPALVGFGVIENNSQELDLGDMTVNLALVCDELGGTISSPAQVANKKVWLTALLAEVAIDSKKQQALDKAMTELAKEL